MRQELLEWPATDSACTPCEKLRALQAAEGDTQLHDSFRICGAPVEFTGQRCRDRGATHPGDRPDLLVIGEVRSKVRCPSSVLGGKNSNENTGWPAPRISVMRATSGQATN